MTLEFTKISDNRYESTNGQFALVSDLNDNEDWHILDENEKVVGASNGEVDLAIHSARIIAGEIELPSEPPM